MKLFTFNISKKLNTVILMKSKIKTSGKRYKVFV
jgi:hypothetical protein